MTWFQIEAASSYIWADRDDEVEVTLDDVSIRLAVSTELPVVSWEILKSGAGQS